MRCCGGGAREKCDLALEPPYQPHPRDALSGAGYARANFKLRLAAKFWLKFCIQLAVTPRASPLLGAFCRCA